MLHFSVLVDKFVVGLFELLEFLLQGEVLFFWDEAGSGRPETGSHERIVSKVGVDFLLEGRFGGFGQRGVHLRVKGESKFKRLTIINTKICLKRFLSLTLFMYCLNELELKMSCDERIIKEKANISNQRQLCYKTKILSLNDLETAKNNTTIIRVFENQNRYQRAWNFSYELSKLQLPLFIIDFHKYLVLYKMQKTFNRWLQSIFTVMSQLFQQFKAILYESTPDEEPFDIASYEMLADEIYNEVEMNLSFFAKKFDQLLALSYQLLKTYPSEGTSLAVCSNLYQAFVLLAERRPTLITKNQNRLTALVEQLYEMFTMVDFVYDQHWAKPEEGYTEETDFSEDICLTKQIVSYFDRIAETYNYAKFNEFIIQLLPNWWERSESDWKLKFALLMVVSQLGSEIEYPLTIKPFVDCAKLSLTNSHPKVRYAALQMIGQFCDDMKPNFQQIYGAEILPFIFNCTKDEIPRVQSHAMACLTNFLEDFDPECLHFFQPYVNELINLVENFCYNGISIVKETALATMSSCSTIDVLTAEQIERVLGVLNNMLTMDRHQQPEYSQVINLTVECLSMIIYGQSPEKVQKYLPQSITVINSLSQRLSPNYIVNAWSRICCKYQNFTDLSEIFPIILEKVFLMIDSYDSEITVAIEAIDNTLNAFRENIKPYMGQIFEFCKKSVQKQNIDDTEIRPLLYNVLESMVKRLKSQAPDPQYDELAKQTFTFFYDEVHKILSEDIEEGDHNCLQPAMDCLQECIKYVSSMFTDENATKFASDIFNLSNKITSLIEELHKDIEKLKQDHANTPNEIDQEELNDVIKVDEVNIKKLYDARLMIPEVFSSILSVIPLENAKAIIQNLYPYVSNYLQNNLPYEDVRYGLYFLCDFLKAVKYEGIQEFVQVYESTFCDHSLSPNIEIRNCAVFALGELMKEIPAEKTDQTIIYKWLNILWNSLSIPLNDENDKKKHLFAKDNIVSALGKLIFHKRQFYPNILNKQVHQKWLEHLPLNCDRLQGDIQHSFILTLLDQSPQTFISSKEDVFKLLVMFAKYFSKRMNKTDEQVVKNKIGTKSFLFKVKDWPIFQDNSDYLWNNLPVNQKTILTQLMSAP